MNNEHHNIEELLERGRGLSLSEYERDELKSALLSYAQYHGRVGKGRTTARAFAGSWWFRSAAATAVVLFAFVGTGYASLGSLPGDALYPAKVHIVEEVVGALQFDEQERLHYSISRMERRLDELKTLEARELLTPERLEEIGQNMGSHVGDLDSILEQDADGSISQETVLMATGDAVAVLEAVEQLLGAHGTTTEDSLEAVSESAVELHAEELEDLVELGDTSMMRAYSETRLRELAEQLAEEGQASSSAAERVRGRVEDAASALEAGDLERAVRLIHEVSQEVDADAYLHSDEEISIPTENHEE